VDTEKTNTLSMADELGALSAELETLELPESEPEMRETASAGSRSADRFADRRMPLYAQAAARHPVLDAASERALAKEIMDLSAELWATVLSDPSTSTFAEERAVEHFPAARRAVAGIAGPAARARSLRTAASRQSLRRAADKAAARLGELDRDHEVIDELVAEIEAAARDPRHAPAAIARAARTRAFARHVERVSRASAAVTASRHRLARSNIGLVFHVAAKYSQRGMSLPDLVQEGMIGLLKAIDRFDYRRGFRFSTYATWWIRHAIGRALSDKSRIIRVPVHVQESYQRLTAVSRRLRASLGREPTVAEIAREAGVTPQSIESVREAVRNNPVSLDEQVGDDEDRTRHEILALADPDSGTPVDAIQHRALADLARREMKGLSRVEIDVLRKRFALDGIDHEWTLQEIADTYGLSRERIRQIQDRALQRLRASLEDRHQIDGTEAAA
jgi:RNA polymerase primary sigma factor